MKKTKQFLSVLLALMMIISIIPMSSITASAATLIWPVPGHTNLSQGYHSGHAGIDISDGSIGGADVVAAMSGTVSNIYSCPDNHYGSFGDCGGFGTGVIIRGDDGRWYQYAHMQGYSIPSNVYVGAYVTAGTKVGKVGNTGNSSGNHLHFQINTSNAWNGPVNPQSETYSHSVSYFTSVWADNITKTDAIINATIIGTNLSTCGFYIGKSPSSMVKKTETVNGYVENIWYTMSTDYGSLEPSTTYYYKFFITVGGTEYCSDVKTFRTVDETYTIAYSANGGSGAPSSQTKIHGTTLKLSSTVPTRAGYTFLGWSTSRTATTATYSAGDNYTTNASAILYAVWQKNPETVSSISVATQPTKTEYYVGDSFDSAGLAIKVVMSDGTTKTITSGFTIAKPDMTTSGTKTVNVSYGGKTTSFTINVKEKADTPDTDVTISIQRPSTTTIRYKDGIILHANVKGELPEGASVVWYVSNDNFEGGYLDDGMSCVFVSKNNGYTTIYAVIEDADGNQLVVDSIELRSNAGFFQKIGGFFRALFGNTTIYEY